MIRHLVRLMWNRKRQNLLLMAEVFVAFLVVVAVAVLPPGRLTRPRLRVRSVLEAEAGSLARWGITRGVTLTIGRAP